ncbi:hypothetical protein [Holdemania filiformis]|uniref:hypothetical protein n=1 Tax=Holdemania filiformis TaxID=61171 RepID=UPI00242AE29E|nr:hypothetical protein [Holdemania filiformis]
MKERGFWNRYGLMLLGILLYGIDLALIIFVTQRLYKNIVEVSFVTALPPMYFVFWLMRGKEGREKSREDEFNSRLSRWLVPSLFFAMALYIGVEMPYKLEWGYSLAIGAGTLLYHACLRKRIPGWGQRLSEIYVCILVLEFFLLLSFPWITGLRTVNQAEAILARQGDEEIHYTANISPSELKWIFKDDVPELTRSEKKTGFYVFSAVDQGEAIGVIISPASGRIIVHTSVSENAALNSIISH